VVYGPPFLLRASLRVPPGRHSAGSVIATSGWGGTRCHERGGLVLTLLVAALLCAHGCIDNLKQSKHLPCYSTNFWVAGRLHSAIANLFTAGGPAGPI
jgi:hypothetical protein